MRIACWITKAAGTHAEYVTLIDFPRQQWLREHVSLLRYGTLPELLKYINSIIRMQLLFFYRRKNDYENL